VIKETIDRLRLLVDPPEPEPQSQELGLVLTGGGARAAYQVGVLNYIAENIPDSRFSIMIGVSAGAINAAHFANFDGTFPEASRRLVELWRDLRSHHVYEIEPTFRVLRTVLLRAMRGQGNGGNTTADLRSLANTSPLRAYLKEMLGSENGALAGVTRNLKAGNLRAVAIVTLSYTTGQTITWVQGDNFKAWERPNRIGINTRLTVDHIMASTSLPFLFPAVNIGDAWHGDGGIRLSAPLAPAIHLGADRVLAISTRYSRTRAEADEPLVVGYPPASQLFGMLTNAVFLDALDEDAHMMKRINRLLEELESHGRGKLRPVKLLLLRPSVDLGKLARNYEATLPTTLEIFSRMLGTEETQSPDWLSMLLFERDYIFRLIDIGYEDARRQHDEIEAFFEPPVKI
jgi:NTE family protein